MSAELDAQRELTATALAEVAEVREMYYLMRGAAIKTADIVQTALDKLIRAKKVVDAASEFLDDPKSVNSLMALSEAVHEYHKKGMPS